MSEKKRPKRGLTKGDVIPLNKRYNGSNERGEWFLVRHTWEGTKDSLAIWATNPKTAKEITGAIKVKDIYCAYPTHEKGKDGQWYTSVEYRVEMEQAEQDEIDAVQATFEELDKVEDDDLPFA